MTKNKLIFEDCCLTIEQAKELRDLGYEFSNSLLCFDRKRNLHIGNAKDFIPYPNCMVNTLTDTEMLEMLPKTIEVKDVLYELYLKKSSFYIRDIAYELGYREYLNESLSINEFTYPLLRDALFEMLRCLKQNKLM